MRCGAPATRTPRRPCRQSRRPAPSARRTGPHAPGHYNCAMRALEELTQGLVDVVRSATAAGDAPDPIALSFLLRRYHATDDASLGEALGVALAAALARYTDHSSIPDRVAWLPLFGV